MSELPIQQGGLRIFSGIVPASSASTYGTHYSYLGIGGYVEVPNIDYRDSIPVDSNMNDEGYSTGRRRYGMLTYVIDEDKLYRLFPYSGGSVVSLETFTGVSDSDQVTMLSNNDGWIEVPDLSVLITGGTYFSGTSSIELYDSTGGTVSITGITTTDVIEPADGRVLVATGDSVNTFVALSNMVFTGSTLNITGDTYISTTGGTKHSSAILHLDSKTKGLLFPVLTTAEKEAIQNPTSGLTVYDSTIEDISVYTSSGWTGVIAERDNLQKVTERGNSTNTGLIVSGTTYIVGSGTSSSTNSLIIQDLNKVTNFVFRDDGYISSRGALTIGTTTQQASGNENLVLYRSQSNTRFVLGNPASAQRNDIVFNNSLGGYLKSSGDLLFATNNTDRLRIDKTSGNVLIGTTTDGGYKLDVSGTTNTERLRVSSSGAPSIQTTGNRLTINEPSNGPTNETGFVTQFSSGDYGRSIFAITHTAVNTAFFGLNGTTNFTIGSEKTTPITFRQGMDYASSNILSSGTERMRISSSGNLLIGTTTDAGYKLYVNGTSRFLNSLTGTSSTFTGTVIAGQNVGTSYNHTFYGGLGSITFQRFDSYANPNFVTITQPNYSLAANGSQLLVTHSTAGNKGSGSAIAKILGTIKGGGSSILEIGSGTNSINASHSSVLKVYSNGMDYFGPTYSGLKYIGVDVRYQGSTANYGTTSGTSVVSLYLQSNFNNRFSSTYLPLDSWKGLQDDSVFDYMITPYTTIDISPTFTNTIGGTSLIGLNINPSLSNYTGFTAIQSVVGNVNLNVVSGSTNIGTSGNTDFKLYVSGTSRFLSSITGTSAQFEKLNLGDSTTSSNTTRSLNLVSTDAVMRVLRVSPNSNTASPAVELMHRTSADGTNTAYWDFYVNTLGFIIRNRTTIDTNVLTISPDNNVLIGTTTDAGYKLDVNGGTRIKGAGSTSGTTGFTVVNSSNEVALQVLNNKWIGMQVLSPLAPLHVYYPGTNPNTKTIAIFDGYQNPAQPTMQIQVGTTNNNYASYFGHKTDMGGFVRNLSDSSFAMTWGSTQNIGFGGNPVRNNTVTIYPRNFQNTNEINTTGAMLRVATGSIQIVPQTATPDTSMVGLGIITLNSLVLPKTYTNASNLYIDGPPVAGSNTTITNRWSIYVNSGSTYFGGKVMVGLTGDTGFQFTSSGSTLLRGSGTTSASYALATQNSSGGTTMVVNNAGNVLIGTTTDAGYKLDVNGTAKFTGTVSMAGGTIVANTYTVGGLSLSVTNSGHFSSRAIYAYSGNIGVTGESSLGAGPNGSNSSGVYAKMPVSPIGSTFTDSDGVFNTTYKPIGLLSERAIITTGGTSSVMTNGVMLQVMGSTLLTSSVISNSIPATPNTAYGLYIKNTLVATNNNNSLIGLDIQPTFTPGSYTGLTQLALRVSGGTQIIGSGSTGTTLSLFSVDGASGRLFDVTDDFTNSLFSVNTSSGVPVIEAFANNSIVMGTYGSNTLVVSGNSVNIGTSTSRTTSVLNISSSTKGVQFPRMTTTQKNSLTGATDIVGGLVVYDTDTNKLCCYNGTTWNDLF